ncbi:MAG: hypothetical protein KDD99_03720 [Bacteroidetes bacterium]|nr:hypothetical protein [Bacteroidota bacterium]
MNLRIRLYLCAIFFSFTGVNIHAQHTNVTDWLFEASFLILDENQNDLLTRAELGKFEAEYGWFLKPENFARADRNHNAGLDRLELSTYSSVAQAYRNETETKELESLHQKYSYFQKATAKYFKRHPELAIQLLDNLAWTRAHTEVVEKLISDRKWLRDYPDAIVSLHKNLTLLVEYPQIAKTFYEQKETRSLSPEFDNWRSRHLSFIRKNPSESETETGTESFASRSKADNAEILRLKHQIQDLQAENASLQKNQIVESRKYRTAIDSLQKSNRKFEKQVELLNKEVFVLKDSLKNDLKNIAFKDAEELHSLEELKKQVRYMKIEKQLARIEEDSLLAENIRYRKQIGHLEKQLAVYTDSSLDDNLELQKLEKQLSNVLVELELQKKAKNTVADSIYIAYENLSKMHSKLTDDYQILLNDKENLLNTLEENLDKKEDHIEKLELAGTQEEVELKNELIQLKQEAKAYKASLDSLLIAQENKDWEISDLKQKKSLLQTQVESLEMEKSQTVDLSHPEKEETELLQENIKLESQLARLERIQKEERERKAAEKDSLLAQMDELHSELIETRNTLSLLESVSEVDTSTISWFLKAQEGYDKQIARYRVKIDELQYDNQKLRQQLEVQIQVAEETEKTLISELEDSRKVAMRLNNRNEKLRSRKGDKPLSSKVNDMLEELEEAQQQIVILSKENKALRDQLETNFTYLSQQLRQQKKLEREVGTYTAQATRLANQNDSLNKKLSQTAYSNIDWTDSMRHYRSMITDVEEQILRQQQFTDNQRVLNEQVVDSLKEEIKALQNKVKKLSNIEQVTADRIEYNDQRERQLNNYENKLRERNQIITQKEYVIQEKLKELDRKEKKYQDLLEREKQLDLREQRLNVKSGG